MQDLHENSDWWRDPAFLYTEKDSWEIQPCKSLSKEENIVEQYSAFASSSSLVADQSSLWNYKRFSSAVRLQWTVARVISVFKQSSFKGMQTKHITTETLEEARRLLIKDVQSTMSDLKSTNKGRYKQLKPIKNEHMIWVIGSRLARHNPLTDDAPQWLLPCNHEYTRLLMKDAHEVGGHRRRDGTLARFRGFFWTPQGAMGQLPLERLNQHLHSTTQWWTFLVLT